MATVLVTEVTAMILTAALQFLAFRRSPYQCLTNP